MISKEALDNKYKALESSRQVQLAISKDFPFYRLINGTDKVPENTVMGDYFFKHDSSCCYQNEIVYAGDCFDTYSEEQNDMEFYEYCMGYNEYAFSMLWEK